MSHKNETELLYARTCNYPGCLRACNTSFSHNGNELSLCGEHDTPEGIKETLNPDPKFVEATTTIDEPITDLPAAAELTDQK